MTAVLVATLLKWASFVLMLVLFGSFCVHVGATDEDGHPYRSEDRIFAAQVNRQTADRLLAPALLSILAFVALDAFQPRVAAAIEAFAWFAMRFLNLLASGLPT